MKKMSTLAVILTLIFTLVPQLTFAAPKSKAAPNEPQNFNRKKVLSGGIHADFIIVSLPKYKKAVNEVFDYAFTEIEKIAQTFNNSNPDSELSKVAAASGKEPVKVSPETLALAKHAREIAEWTKGAFDPVKGPANYKSFKINEKNSTLFLKKPGTHLEFGEILEGFMADLFIRAAHAAEIENAFVQVNGVRRAMGRASYGPWTIQITGYSESTAKHGRRIIISNYSAATVGGETPPPTVDPRSGKPLETDLYSVTVVTKQAATSQGVANSVFVLGPRAGKDLIDSLGIRAILAFRDGSMKQVGNWPSDK